MLAMELWNLWCAQQPQLRTQLLNCWRHSRVGQRPNCCAQARAQPLLQASCGNSARFERLIARSAYEAGSTIASTSSRIEAAFGAQFAGAAAAPPAERPAVPRTRNARRSMARKRFMAKESPLNPLFVCPI